jgi:sulfur carrier protein
VVEDSQRGGVELIINGKSLSVRAGTVSALLEFLGYGDEPRGIAVAVNGEVVPRGRWVAQPVAEGDRVEIVGAVQGG